MIFKDNDFLDISIVLYCFNFDDVIKQKTNYNFIKKDNKIWNLIL